MAFETTPTWTTRSRQDCLHCGRQCGRQDSLQEVGASFTMACTIVPRWPSRSLEVCLHGEHQDDPQNKPEDVCPARSRRDAAVRGDVEAASPIAFTMTQNSLQDNPKMAFKMAR
eukprot:8288978-Pyramimonas_sp.AAC.1